MTTAQYERQVKTWLIPLIENIKKGDQSGFRIQCQLYETVTVRWSWGCDMVAPVQQVSKKDCKRQPGVYTVSYKYS